jgi:hypothetical protein
MSSEFGGGMKDKRDRRDIPVPLFRPLRYALCAMPYACLPAGRRITAREAGHRGPWSQDIQA